MWRIRVKGTPADRLADWRRLAQLPAVAAGLGLAEVALVAQAGPPARQLEPLRHLADAGADPLACLLAFLTLIAEALVAYLLVVLTLRSLSLLQGAAGRLADRVMLLITPVTVRRMVELLVGGSLLVQAAVALPSTQPSHRDGPGRVTIDGTAVSAGDALRAAGLSDLAAIVGDAPTDVRATRGGSAGAETRAVDTRPTPRRKPAPLPPWLGGGPSISAPGAIRCHDRLEARREARSPPSAHGRAPRHPLGHRGGQPRARSRSAANVHRYWQQIYRANRSVIGDDPDLIRPGTKLDVPPYRRDHR
jgi:hypothetical protein